jgi:hypothetical protein
MPSERTPEPVSTAPASTSAADKGPLARKGHLITPGMRRRAGQVLRMCGFLATLTVIGVFAEYQHVSGQVGEELVSLGDRLMDYEGASSRDETREVVFNGQSMLFSTGRTDDGFASVLEHFETVCAGHDGGLTERYEAAQPRGRDAGHSPVFRYDTEHSGVVACLDFGATDVSVTELGERVRRYGETHDLHDLGDLRYVYAERNEANTSTHFVTFWTDGSFRMDAIFPEDGDGGGEDLADVARPPGARRTISATETGTNDTVVQYVGSTMTEWELEGFYEHELAASGWAVQDLPEQASPTGIRVVAARRDNSELYVTLDTDARGRGQATIVLGQ